MVQYWRFYWPLALTGLAVVLSVQFQNAALARFPEAVTELAVFALAYSTFGFFRACLNFIAQLSNVFARSPVGTMRTQRFVLAASVLIMLPLLAIGHTQWGAAGIAAVYGIDMALTARVIEYLVYLAPLVLLSAQRFYYTGLLVQARLTGWVTTLTVIYLVSLVAGLVVGFTLGYQPVYVLVGSEAVALVIHVCGSLWVKIRSYQPPAIAEHEDLTYRELAGFFIPVSTTGVMFALSRPVLYAFVARTPDGVLAIAAMRVAFDFAMIFQQAANQFRHFFVTFGLDDLAVKRKFMAMVCAGITAIMLLIALTPLSNLIWRDLMGIPDAVREISVDVMLVMCLIPAVIIFRNYYHGRLMVERRTAGMAAGGILRVIGIYGLAQGFFAMGWLDHMSASFILILGFVIEAAVVLYVAQKGQGLRANATAKI
ncbi:MAG: hypothetical protein OES38_07315 [Gammaproteobacteria bacterium]|nr:hypothetical protein [Gammaproteobacteria bacterium]